jgi:protein-arginine kinase activator protein McsA
LEELEELLQEAIDNEDYMKAAEIRDEINRRKGC